MDHVDDDYFVIQSNNREILCKTVKEATNFWRKFHTRPISKYIRKASIKFNVKGSLPANIMAGIINTKEDSQDSVWKIKSGCSLYAFRLTRFVGSTDEDEKEKNLNAA